MVGRGYRPRALTNHNAAGQLRAYRLSLKLLKGDSYLISFSSEGSSGPPGHSI